MWSHYTENHKGFVLGFDSNHDFFKKQGTDEGDIGELRNVVYSDDRPEISLNNIKISTVLHEVKNIDWKYEEEMRLVRNTKNAALALTDREPSVFLFDIPKDSISSVIFGMQCAEE